MPELILLQVSLWVPISKVAQHGLRVSINDAYSVPLVALGEELDRFDRPVANFEMPIGTSAVWKSVVGMLARCDKLQEGGLPTAPALKVVASLSFRLIEPLQRAANDSLGCVRTFVLHAI